MTSIRRILLNSQDSAIITLLLIVGGLIGARDIVKLVLPSDLSFIFIVAVFAVIVARSIIHERRISRLAPLPMQPGKFTPFGFKGPEGLLDVWPRESEATVIAERIASSQSSHFLVSGPSGAGKSTLIERLVIPKISDTYHSHIFREYNNIVLRIIEVEDGDEALLAKQREISTAYLNFVSANKCHPSEVLDQDFLNKQPEAKALWSKISKYLDSTYKSGLPRCFVFDQIERFLHVMFSDAEGASTANGYDLLFFINFMKFCRKNPELRTLLIIRSDSLYESVYFLEAVVSGSAGQFNYFLCPGINTETSPRGVRAIRSDINSLGLNAEATHNFDQICRLDSRAHSNTFLTQMIGYTVEHFFKSDKQVQAMLSERYDRSEAVKCYFNHFLNDYVRETASTDSLEAIKAALFAIATENAASGHNATLSRIVALTHMPADAVTHAVNFAHAAGIITEDMSNGEPAYRMIHDLISEYVRGNEQFSVHPVLKDSIRGLSESRIPTKVMTKVERHADVLRDIWEAPNLGLYALWTFFVFGILQSRWEQVCDWSSGFTCLFFRAENCDIVMTYYLPVYIAHVVWLVFIYHIHRDYLRYVLRSNWLRMLSASMPAIGSILAILMSQTPELIVMPIAVVGVIMGILLIMGVVDGSFVGSEAELRGRWGIRTIANMLFTSCLSGLTWLFFWSNPKAVQFWDQLASWIGNHIGIAGLTRMPIAYIWMFAVAGVLIYFWVHIRPEQQSRVASAARLAAYDRSRCHSYG